jgi:hypothetical protein
VGFQNAGRTAPEQTGNGPQLSSSAADFQANSQIERPAQAEILRNPCAVAHRLAIFDDNATFVPNFFFLD